MSDWYDRKGSPIGMADANRLLADRDYKILQQDHVGDLWISTVWLGLDHKWGGAGPPLIFETMVFGQDWADLESDRYPTEAAARAGHAEIVKRLAGDREIRPCPADCPDPSHGVREAERLIALANLRRWHQDQTWGMT